MADLLPYKYFPPTEAEYEVRLIETELERCSGAARDAVSDAIRAVAQATVDKIRAKPGPHRVKDWCADKDALRKLAALMAINRLLSTDKGFACSHDGEPLSPVTIGNFLEGGSPEQVKLTMLGPPY